MTTAKQSNEIPELPPPHEIPIQEPQLEQQHLRRLRRAYTLWCSVTVSAALLTLSLLGVQAVQKMQNGGDGYLRRLILTRVLGIGAERGEDSLLELMIGQVLYPRSGTRRGLPDAADSALADTTQAPSSAQTAPLTAEEDLAASARPLDVYAYDPELVPAGEMPILPLDLSLAEYGSLYISNETAYTPDLAALIERDDVLPSYSYTSATIYPPGEPLVLILHTHGTEAYSPEGAISYPTSDDYARSSDPQENVVAVGARMAEVLSASGVPTLHCVILHDKSAYRDAYVRAAETIRAYLAEYPSIAYILDVHRDALIRGENELVKPVVAIDGEAVAQVMILAGSDYKGAVFPHWERNLAFALQLREALNQNYPHFARPVYLRGAAFNEHLGPLSLLLEIGASGNSLGEALRAGELVAQTLAEMIKGS